jgi:hypothetical protein
MPIPTLTCIHTETSKVNAFPGRSLIKLGCVDHCKAFLSAFVARIGQNRECLSSLSAASVLILPVNNIFKPGYRCSSLPSLSPVIPLFSRLCFEYPFLCPPFFTVCPSVSHSSYRSQHRASERSFHRRVSLTVSAR